ncbi:MAG: M28 family peptidase [Bacteroidetes bacterium]|nr:M28 family peptidase [Bacteroidota bacterium]
MAISQNEDALKYAATITKEDAYDKLSIIASDAMEGRETGQRGQKMAAAFIEYHFKQLGLLPPVKTVTGMSYRQNVPLTKSSPGEIYLKFSDQKLVNFEDMVYRGSVNQPVEVTSDIVFGGNGTESDYGSIDVRDKAVLIFSGSSLSDWRSKRDLAAKNGAKLVVLVTADDDDAFNNMITRYQRFLSSARMRLDNSSERPKSIGVFYIAPSQAAEIFSTTPDKLAHAISDQNAGKIKALKKIKPGEITYKTEMIKESISSENILGYLEGTDKKDELIIITAHYDHIGKNGDAINNGADDDGSGTTIVIELAEAFVQAKNEGKGPRRSILFMTVTGEEKGLLGSEFYTDNPVFPLENTVVDLNVDMIGRIDPKHKENPDYIYLVGTNRLSTELHEISEKVNETFTQFELDYEFNDESHPDRFYYRSDHWNFAKNNVPIIFYFNGTHEDYHRESDTVDKINFDLLVKRGKLVFHTAWVIANREERLVVDVIQGTKLDSKD